MSGVSIIPAQFQKDLQALSSNLTPEEKTKIDQNLNLFTNDFFETL